MKPPRDPVASARIYRRRHRAKHYEAIAAKKREEYKKNSAAYLKRAAAWKEANPERLKELSRTRYATREEVRQRFRASNRRNSGLPEPGRPEPIACECCTQSGGKTRKGYDRALSLDHCHTSGAFRGWLCHRCNMALGLLGDDIPEAIVRLTRYLEIQTTLEKNKNDD